MAATKTTFHLDDGLRVQLKEVAARTGKTVTELLTEGAKLVLARGRHDADRDELRRRAQRARERLRRGLYAGPPIAAIADDVIYGAPGPRARRTRKRG